MKVLKCLEGSFNKALLLTMDNGTEVMAKLPNPNAGPAFYTTASEVATHHFVGDIEASSLLTGLTNSIIGKRRSLFTGPANLSIFRGPKQRCRC